MTTTPARLWVIDDDRAVRFVLAEVHQQAAPTPRFSTQDLIAWLGNNVSVNSELGRMVADAITVWGMKWRTR